MTDDTPIDLSQPPRSLFAGDDIEVVTCSDCGDSSPQRIPDPAWITCPTCGRRAPREAS